MRRRAALLVVLSLAVAGAGACGGGGGDSKGKEEGKGQPGAPLSGDAPVRIVNFEFKPQKMVVKPGTKVTWTNDDTNIHDIKDTSPLNTPVSQELSKGETFAITYAQPGSYSYVCGIHPYMTGTVEVVQ
jgi:plastocyanin